MRRFRWPLAILAFLLLLIVVAAFRKPADDYAEIRPFVVQEQTKYLDATYMKSLAWTTPSAIPPAMRDHTLWVKGMPEQQLMAALERRAKRFPAWTIDPHSHAPFLAHKGPFYSGYLACIRGVGWTSAAKFTDADFTIREMQPMSSMEVFWLRIKSLGKDPFARP